MARHLASLLIVIPLVPAAYVLLDYATFRGMIRFEILEEDLPAKVYITMGIAAGCLFLAAAAGRISGFGPLVGAILWGALPTLWIYGDISSYVDAVNDLPEAYDNQGFGLMTMGLAVYPITGALLLGAAVAGRWRRPAAESY